MKYLQQLNIILRSAGARSAGVYVFSNFFAKGTAFILLFIYSNPKYLSVEENGLLNLLANAVFILMPFLSLGILQSTSVDFFKLSKPAFKDFFTTSFIIPLMVTVVSIVCLLFFNDALENLYGFPLAFCYIIPILAFLNFCNEQYVGLIRNNNKPVTYLKATLLRLFIEVGLSITLVVVFAWRWHGRVTGMMTANVVLLVAAFIYFKKHGYLFGKLKKEYLRSELVFALPVILMQCSTFCLFASDKFFLSYYTDNRVVGIYSYACVFASIITIFSSAVISYIRPLIYQNLSTKGATPELIKKYFLYYVAINLAALIAIIIFTPVMYKYFINSSYYPGLNYMFLIATGYFFSSITIFFYAFILYHKQKRTLIILSVITITISLVSNYLLIRQSGAFGAAISVCISYFITLLLTLVISHKNFSFIFIHKLPVINQ